MQGEAVALWPIEFQHPFAAHPQAAVGGESKVVHHAFGDSRHRHEAASLEPQHATTACHPQAPGGIHVQLLDQFFRQAGCNTGGIVRQQTAICRAVLQAVIDDRQPHAAIGCQPHQVGTALRVVADAQVHPREMPIGRPIQPDTARAAGPHHAVPPAQHRPVAALAQLRLAGQQ
ncbi:hypothetical protein D3C81_826420 [compost metagenome]